MAYCFPHCLFWPQFDGKFASAFCESERRCDVDGKRYHAAKEGRGGEGRGGEGRGGEGRGGEGRGGEGRE